MLNWSFWWIELGNVHGSRLDLLITSILSLFGVFSLLPFDFDYTCQATGICAHEQTRAIPFPRENRITFFLFFFSSFPWSFVYMYESEERRRAEMKMRYLSIRRFLYHM